MPASQGMLQHGKAGDGHGMGAAGASCHEAVKSNLVYNQLMAEVASGHLHQNDWPDPGRMLARRGMIMNHRDVVVSVFAQSDRPGDMSVRVLLYDLETDLELALHLTEEGFVELSAASDWWCTDTFFDRDRKRMIPSARDKASEFLLRCLEISSGGSGTEGTEGTKGTEGKGTEPVQGNGLELVAKPLKDVPDDNELWRGNRNISGVSCEIIVRKADAMRRVEVERLRRIDAAQGELFAEKQRVNKPLIVVLCNRLEGGGDLPGQSPGEGCNSPEDEGLFEARQLRLWLSRSDLSSAMTREIALQPECIDLMATAPHPLLQLVVQRLEIVKNQRSQLHTLRIHNRTIERHSYRVGQRLAGVYYLLKVSPGAAGRLHLDASRPTKPTEVPLMLTVTQKELDTIAGGRGAALMNCESATHVLQPYLDVLQNERKENVMLLKSKEEVDPDSKKKRFAGKKAELAKKVGAEFNQMLFSHNIKRMEKEKLEVEKDLENTNAIQARQWARVDVAKPAADYHLQA